MTHSAEETPIETGQKKAEETVEAAKSRAARLADDARHTASDLASGARSRVEAEITARGEAARDGVASAVEDGAETLRTAAERMSEGTPQSEAVNRAANSVYGLADQIRETTAESAAETVSAFARRHPAPFLAGAALAGFAAGRFLKSSSRPTHSSRPSSGGSHGSDRDIARPAPAPVRPDVPQSMASRTPASPTTGAAPGPATPGSSSSDSPSPTPRRAAASTGPSTASSPTKKPMTGSTSEET